MNNFKKILCIILLILCFGQIYFQRNSADLLGRIALHSFGKNDVRALQYAEEAFRSGNIDSELRERYVDTILQKEMTLSSQEKLYKFLEYEVDDIANVKVEQAFYDLRREVFYEYPNNYISQAPVNQKILRWSSNPIKYSFTAEKDAEVPFYFTEEIIKAFQEWEKATDRKVCFVQDDKMPDIIVLYRAENPADEEDKKYIAAFARPIFNANKLEYSQIDFYLHKPSGEYYSKNYVYNTALHEIAHALGIIGHSGDRRNILYLSSNPTSVLLDKREKLSEADIVTMKLLYDIKPDITKGKAEGKYIPYVVLGGKEDIVSAKMREAKNYIKKAPQIPAGYIDLAEAYSVQKEYKKSLANLLKALKYANDEEMTAMINYNIAITYYNLKNYEIAMSYLEKASLYKEDEEISKLRFLLYKELKDVDKMQDIISKNSQNIEYVIILMNFYIENKQPLKARKVLKDFINQNPVEKNNPRFNSYGWIKMFL